MARFFDNWFANDKRTEFDILNAPFCMKFPRDHFEKIKTENLYKKILQRCYSRSEGAQDAEKIQSLFDSSEKSGSPRGLISLLAKAMTDKAEIAIIYEAGVVRLATSDEKEQIKKDYEDKAKSSLGILVSFKDYCLTDLVKGYMSMIYDILSSMNTQVGLAKALQIKVAMLRSTVSVNGKDEPIAQAKAINEALTKGQSVLMDEKDRVEVLKLDSASVEAAFKFVCSLLASDLGVSLSFITGELTTGMSATGEADSNADEYGFQDYFNSIFKPSCDKLYGWNLVFVSDDWRYTGTMLDKLIIVENSSILSDEQKRIYAERTIPISDKN